MGLISEYAGIYSLVARRFISSLPMYRLGKIPHMGKNNKSFDVATGYLKILQWDFTTCLDFERGVKIGTMGPGITRDSNSYLEACR